MLALQQISFVCVNSVSQWAASEAFKTNLKPVMDIYRRRRDLVFDMLKTKYELQKPEGTFYAYPKVPGSDPDLFFSKCLEKNILVVPGKLFSKKNTHFRVSFA